MGDRMNCIRFAHVVPGNGHTLGARQVVVCSDRSSRFHQCQGRILRVDLQLVNTCAVWHQQTDCSGCHRFSEAILVAEVGGLCRFIIGDCSDRYPFRIWRVLRGHYCRGILNRVGSKTAVINLALVIPSPGNLCDGDW